MQVHEIRVPTVRRDMDLIRQVLLKLEADPKLDGTRWVHYTPDDLGLTDRSAEELAYHLGLLIEEGFLRGSPMTFEGLQPISRLTWKGHEFLSDIRDESIWGKTKDRAKGLADVGMNLIWEIAKAEIKTKLGLP
jgi:hypothetical protein